MKSVMFVSQSSALRADVIHARVIHTFVHHSTRVTRGILTRNECWMSIWLNAIISELARRSSRIVTRIVGRALRSISLPEVFIAPGVRTKPVTPDRSNCTT